MLDLGLFEVISTKGGNFEHHIFYTKRARIRGTEGQNQISNLERTENFHFHSVNFFVFYNLSQSPK